MWLFAALLPLVALAAAIPVAVADEAVAPAPPSLSIVSITYGGTGCPQETLKYSFGYPWNALTLFYPESSATTGGDIALSESRKNCQVNLQLKYPAGWSYSISSSTYAGHVSLDKGASASQKVYYYFSGQTDQATDETTWTGPVNKDYLVQLSVAAKDAVWSPCDGGESSGLNMNNIVRVDGGDSNARGKLSTWVGQVSLGFGVQWKRC